MSALARQGQHTEELESRSHGERHDLRTQENAAAAHVVKACASFRFTSDRVPS